MSVEISCPRCRQRVHVIADGYVKKHYHGDKPCDFTRTAHSNVKPRAVRREATKVVSARELKQVSNTEMKAEERSTRRRDGERPITPKPGQVRCAECGSLTYRAGGSATGLDAHKTPAGKWCHGGGRPSRAQRRRRDRAAKKRSVWAVGGGLPTLGKR